MRKQMIVFLSIFIGMGILLAFPGILFAQLQLNGSVDLEVPIGGESSSFISNEIPNEYRHPHFSIAQLNVFLFAPVSDQFFFESRVQMDTWGTGRLNEPRISLANLTWDNPDNNYTISAGRFISPFGFYAKRQLALDRVFVALPLAYDYFVNMSDKRGYWPQAGNTGSYTQRDVGLSTVYFANYATGISTHVEIEPNKWSLDAALTNGTPASQADYTNLANASGMVRVQYNPSIYWQQGFSVSHGSFMQFDQINSSVRSDNPLEQYRQTLVGTDMKLGYTYFEIISEVIYSHWKVPRFNDGFFSIEGNNKLTAYRLSNLAWNVDIKYEPPVLTGSYIGLRAESMYFFEAEDPDPQSGESIKWDKDVARLTLAAGYKLARNVLGKISYSDQTPFDTSRSAFRLCLTAFF